VQSRLRLALISETRLPPSPLKGELCVLTLALSEIVPNANGHDDAQFPLEGARG